MRWLATATLSLLAAACSPEDPTRVFVTIEADRAVQQRATQLRLAITRDPEGAAKRVHDGRRDAKFPLVLELYPESGAARTGYRLEVTALDGAQGFVTARLESGYVEGADRFVALRLEDACIDVVCSDDESCHDGTCQSSNILPRDLGADADDPPQSYDIISSKPMPPRDGAVSPMNGRLDDAGVDAGDQTPFTNGMPDAADTLPRDAGDAAAVDLEASVVSDAAAPRDAQNDAAPSAPCMPSGEFMVSAIETGGTCKLPPGSFPVALRGKLEDFLPDDMPCNHVAKVAPNGCSLTFTLKCSVSGEEEAYDEEGEAHVEAPDHIVITSSTLVYRPLSQNCTSLRRYDMRPAKP